MSCLSKFLKSFVFHEKIFFISVDFCSSYLGNMCQVDFLDVQHDLNSLQNWSLTDNEIFFQPSKCVNLTITRKRQSSERLYRLMDKDLKFVSSAKDLGFTVLKDLKWTHLKTFIFKHCMFFQSIYISYKNTSLHLMGDFTVKLNL